MDVTANLCVASRPSRACRASLSHSSNNPSLSVVLGHKSRRACGVGEVPQSLDQSPFNRFHNISNVNSCDYFGYFPARDETRSITPSCSILK